MNEPLSQTQPFSLRLTAEERARLEQEAGDMPLGAYIRSLAFRDDISRKRTRSKRPVKDHQTLAQVLAALGTSRIPNNLNQLAKAANSGSLPITPETEAMLKEACSATLWMRHALMQALGLKVEDSP